MDSQPSLVILTTSGVEGHNIVKGILEIESVGAARSECGGGVEWWRWEVDNKYYTASVQLAVVAAPEEALSWIKGNGEALLIYCDATQNNVLETLNGLVEKLGDFEPEVQLLVCDSCSSSDDDQQQLSKLTAQQWCISNGWELIELVPHSSEPEYSDEEDDFPESVGFKRIRQALHAHTWSNLSMKDSQGSRLGAVLQSVSAGEERSGSGDVTQEALGEVMYSRLADLTLSEDHGDLTPETDLPWNEVGSDHELGEGVLDTSAFGGGEVGCFEDLFSNFAHLKRTAAGLPPDQRRDYAERVAVAFWRAMGGDEDEVTGLDSEGEV